MVKVAIVQRNLNENLAAMQLSACLKAAGHEVDCFIEAEEKDLVSAVKAYGADIIGFTAISGMHNWCVETATKLKNADNLLIFGGPHPTFFPDILEEDALDAICIGEGEGALLELADAYPDINAIKKISNLHVKAGGKVHKNPIRPLIEDLDTLPYPDRDLVYKYPSLARNSRKTIMCSRGCPYSCTFCFNSAYRKLYGGHGKAIRYRSAENIIGEILDIKERYGMKSVYFQDDTLIVDHAWMLDFLGKYKERVGLPFTCLLRADLVEEKIVAALKDAGCVAVHFGIESGNERIRNEILKKGVTDEEIKTTARLLKEHGIRFKTYNMLQLPHESIDEAFQTLEMNSMIGTDYPWASILLPYPKTELTEYMMCHGLISKEYDVDDLSSSFFNPKKPSKEEWPFVNLQRLFFYGVKFPFLLPVIKRAIKLPPNPIFDILFFISHAYNYSGSENMSIPDVIYFGLKAVRTSFYGD